MNQQGLLADKEREGDVRVITFSLLCVIQFSGFIEALDGKGIVRTLTRETSQIVQSVMQHCQYFLSQLLPVCNLLIQTQK